MIIKKIIIILACFISTNFSSFAQLRCENYLAEKWLIDLNIPVGLVYQVPTTNFSANYPGALNTKFDNLHFKMGESVGLDLEFGCFFGEYKLYGFGTGIIYQTQFSKVTLDKFHVEYSNTDANGSVFRQVVTSSKPITESLTKSSFSFPVVFKIKQAITKKVGFSVDAGLLINNSATTQYSTDASYDYEAIYAYTLTGPDGAFVHYYDNSPTPSPTDLLLTKQQIELHNPGISSTGLNTIFDSLQARGYNVGFGRTPANKSGSISQTYNSIGFIFRPAVNVRIHERLYFYFGGYIAYQVFNNPIDQNYQMIDNKGSNYSSMLNTISKIDNISIGANIGLRLFFMSHTSTYVCHDEKNVD